MKPTLYSVVSKMIYIPLFVLLSCIGCIDGQIMVEVVFYIVDKNSINLSNPRLMIDSKNTKKQEYGEICYFVVEKHEKEYAISPTESLGNDEISEYIYLYVVKFSIKIQENLDVKYKLILTRNCSDEVYIGNIRFKKSNYIYGFDLENHLIFTFNYKVLKIKGLGHNTLCFVSLADTTFDYPDGKMIYKEDTFFDVITGKSGSPENHLTSNPVCIDFLSVTTSTDFSESMN